MYINSNFLIIINNTYTYWDFLTRFVLNISYFSEFLVNKKFSLQKNHVFILSETITETSRQPWWDDMKYHHE